MDNIIPLLSSCPIDAQRLFLRADLNLPLYNGAITNDYKLQALKPTLDYILQRKAKIIMGTHVGRPHHNGEINQELSTASLAKLLIQQGYKVEVEPDLQKAIIRSHQDYDTILLLENLRFFPEEQASSVEFAKKLAALADMYINDAFGLIHRNDTSITYLAEEYPRHKRAAGLLMAKEITHLLKLNQEPLPPFVVVIGGNKVEDKLPLLHHFIQQPAHKRPTCLLLGGLLSFPFLAASGVILPEHIYNPDLLEQAERILEAAEQAGIKIILPVDHIVIRQKNFPHIPLICDSIAIPLDGTPVDIGPVTIEIFSAAVQQAKTIFFNGTMGLYEEANYAHGTYAVLKSIAQSEAYKVIGGGNATEATMQAHLIDSMDIVSTGGGATLAFVAASNPFKELPGLASLLK